MPNAYPPLADLLEAFPALLSDPGGVLMALASVGVHGVDALPPDARAALESSLRTVSDVDLAHWCARRVRSSSATGGLEAIERIDVAARGLQSIGQGSSPWSTRLASELGRAVQALDERSFDLEERRVAAERAAVLPAGVQPWSAILRAGPRVGAGDVGRWLQGRVAPADDAALRAAVRADPEVRDAYRRAVQLVAASLELRRFDGPWGELAMEANASTHPGGGPRVPLPHLDCDAFAQPRWVAGAPAWVAPAPVISRWHGAIACWGDDVLGEVVTRVVVRRASDTELGWAAVSLLRAADPRLDPATVAREFGVGGLFFTPLEAATALVAGDARRLPAVAAARSADVDDPPATRRSRRVPDILAAGRRDADESEYAELASRVLVAVIARVALQRCAPDAPAVLAADEACAAFGPATQWIDERRYRDYTDDVEFPAGCWAGHRRRLDAWLPDAWVTGRLESAASLVRASAVSPARPVIAFADAGVPSGAVEVPVLLANGSAGAIVDMTIATGDGYFLSSDISRAGFGAVACAAFERAWEAASDLCGGAPRPLHEHTIRFRERPLCGRTDHVDGASLALPAALGFVALWRGHSDTALPVHATGDLVKRGGSWVIGPVGGLLEKRRASARSRDQVRARVFGVEAGDASQPGPWTLQGLIGALGLDEGEVGARAFRDRKSAIDEIEAGVDGVKRSQPLPGMGQGPGGLAWRLTALRLRHAARFLAGQVTDGTSANAIARAHVFARLASAYAHDHEPHDGDERVQEAELRDAVAAIASPEDRSEVQRWIELLELNSCIRLDRWTEGADLARRLSAGVGTALTVVECRLLGTVARFWTHAQVGRDLAEAIRLHRAVIQSFARVDSAEVPRSRIYLAQALLLAGELSEADAELCQAFRELSAPVDVTYAESTLLFWWYARARVDLARGQLDAAERALDEADSRAANWGDFLARGLARVRAQVARARGRSGEADRLAAAVRVRETDPPYLARIVAEAAGAPLPGAMPEAF